MKNQAPISNEQRALLNTIRYAEGTWANGGEDGYRVMFGGGKFDTAKGWRHPDTVIDGGRYKSAAAGAYQFLPGTWKEIASKRGIDPNDFSPGNQDLAALGLVERRGANSRQRLDADMLNKLAPEWASLPTSEGKSYYGQPVKAQKELLDFYNSQLAALSKGGATPAAAGGAAPPKPQAPGAGAAPEQGEETRADPCRH